ncbi:MAG TPA: 50S ribosomal protein L1 [Candidatus Nanoarchaeia archaeon]|nr:50S ribosomal protein L1 [Candidatus Nanoarchaeia archaeon]
MDKARVTKALEQLQAEKQRKFQQSYDFIVTLKDINVKTQPIDAYVVLPHSRGKTVKVCALVGQELAEQAAKNCDLVIREMQFDAYKGKPKDAKKLAKTYDFFIAQANLMTQIAAVFGRSFGPRGKMPNPKAGCVVPPQANLAVLKERLQKTVHVKAKDALMLQCIIGNEKMSMDEVTDNVMAVLTQVTKALPNEEQNINCIYLKKTMSKPVKV